MLFCRMVRRRNWFGPWLLVALVAGCGARTRLNPFDLISSSGGTPFGKGGSSSLGGSSPSGGSGTGAVAGMAATGGSSGFGGFSGSAGRGGTAGTAPTGGDGGIGGASGSSGEGGSGGEGGAGIVATRLSVGAFHSCAGFDDGSLRCWGGGQYIGSGEGTTIGDNETPNATGPVDIGGDVVEFTAGWYHTCALLGAGNVRCFGVGSPGTLGYANTNDIGDNEVPASAGDVSVGGRVRHIAAGPTHACAVLENGEVRCWGNNDRKQLGYAGGAPVGDDETPASVGSVNVGVAVAQVAGGLGHTCVLSTDGDVRCWGTGSGGRLGYGNMSDIGDDETPASAGNVNIGGKATQIVAGSTHTCVLLVNGRVRCWGRGDLGALGYGNANNIGDDEIPASAGLVDVGGTVIELAAGNQATCALLAGGTVRCWGSGEQGQLGYANTENIGDDETPASVGDVNIGGPVTHVAVGFLHVCATLETGAVRCWGRGSTGALGYGNVMDIGDNEPPASAGDVSF
jgi:alpha-tubulin suppressor-like RCC1 family protein